jgi:DNA-binding transcriptional ArsR family regulator
MTDAVGVANMARVLGDESRAAMCLAMLDGSSWTVTELSSVAGVCMATASEHVSKLVTAQIATEERLGRNRFVRLAGPDVAQALETFAALVAPAPASSLRTVGERRRLAAARTCYDHLAGRLGVAVMDALRSRQLVDSGAGLAVTPRGRRWFGELDLDVRALSVRRRVLLRECADWTERRPHLAGSLGAGLCDQFLTRQWVRRTDQTRRLEVTPPGLRALHDQLGIEPSMLELPR